MNYLRERIEAATTPEELAAAIAAAESPTDRWTVKSLGDVASFFGLAVSTVKGWSQEGMPNAGNGWSLPAIVRWRFSRLAGDDLSTARKRQEIELNAIAIETKRLDLAREKGALVSLADVERWAAVTFVTLRECLMSLPEAIATSAPFEIRSLVLEEADRIVRASLTMTRRRLDMQSLASELSIDNIEERVGSE